MSDEGITVWRLVAHHEAPNEASRWFAQSHLIAIGWGRVGSIVSGGYRAAQDVSEAIRKAYPT